MLKPIQDRIVVKRLDAKSQTDAGLFIPETAQEKPCEGTVVAVGTGQVLPDGTVKPLEVQPGDHVIFSNYTGTEIEIEGEPHLVLRENELIGVYAKD